MAGCEQAGASANPVKLALFDFDGTSIGGNSPVVLVKWLVARHQLKLSYFTRILGWGICYKLHLPQNESWVRGLVFSAFEGLKVEDVDVFLRKFYDDRLETIFRKEAHQAMLDCKAQGCKIMMVSATFEPLILQCMEHHPVDYQVSTRMRQTPDGCYTRQVDGLPVEGVEKIRVVRKFANKEFGEGNWTIAYAYGDHYSDKAMLDAAEHPHAVCPDNTLKRYAKLKNWPILEWE
ncbi:MAG: HAD-IB family hydrolase [Coriobacteriia bacterium]|nr:HAD-IB family hydrolase [Coriobacteriia bacterium]